LPLVKHKESIQEMNRDEEISNDNLILTSNTNTVTLTSIEATKTIENNSEIYNSEDSKLMGEEVSL
jgi:hypothetical protein